MRSKTGCRCDCIGCEFEIKCRPAGDPQSYAIPNSGKRSTGSIHFDPPSPARLLTARNDIDATLHSPHPCISTASKRIAAAARRQNTCSWKNKIRRSITGECERMIAGLVQPPGVSTPTCGGTTGGSLSDVVNRDRDCNARTGTALGPAPYRSSRTDAKFESVSQLTIAPRPSAPSALRPGRGPPFMEPSAKSSTRSVPCTCLRCHVRPGCTPRSAGVRLMFDGARIPATGRSGTIFENGAPRRAASLLPSGRRPRPIDWK